MISKMIEIIRLFNELDADTGGVVRIGDKHYSNFETPEIVLRSVDDLVEIAGHMESIIDLEHIPNLWIAKVKCDGFNAVVLINEYKAIELESIRDYNRTVIEDRKEAFKEEMA